MYDIDLLIHDIIEAGYACDRQAIHNMKDLMKNKPHKEGLLMADLALNIADCVEQIIPYIKENPGISEKQIAKDFPDLDQDAITAVIFKYEQDGKIKKDKLGNKTVLIMF